MTNEQALKIVAEFEAVLPAAIKKALAQTVEAEKPKKTAKEYLLEILSKPFLVEINEDFITYHQDGEWLFELDLKNEILRSNYHKLWQFFVTEYSIEYDKIEDLVKGVMCEAFNFKDLMPTIYYQIYPA